MKMLTNTSCQKLSQKTKVVTFVSLCSLTSEYSSITFMNTAGRKPSINQIDQIKLPLPVASVPFDPKMLGISETKRPLKTIAAASIWRGCGVLRSNAARTMIVSGTVKLPSRACKYGGVRLLGLAKTTIIPFSASQSPMTGRNHRHHRIHST